MASAVNGLVLVRFVGNQAGAATVETTCHMKTVAGVSNSQASMQALGDALAAITDGGGDEMQAFCSSSFNFVEVQVEDLSATIFAPTVSPNAWSGDVAGDAAPSSAALVVTKQTTFTGRANRGRYYFGGLPGSAVATAGLGWDVTYTDGFQAFAENVDATAQAIVLVPYAPVLYHRGTDTTTDIASYLARAPIRTQRRRQFGVGS